jgi:hypothetical protein
MRAAGRGQKFLKKWGISKNKYPTIGQFRNTEIRLIDACDFC